MAIQFKDGRPFHPPRMEKKTVNKQWLIGAGKLIGVSMLGAGCVTGIQVISEATFAANPYAQFAILALGFVVTYLKKPAKELRK